MDDPFVHEYEASELKIAAEFLKNWLPFLTRDLCEGCASNLRDRVRSLDLGAVEHSGEEGDATDRSETRPASPGSVENGAGDGVPSEPVSPSPRVRMSWADMAQEDEDVLGVEAEEVKGQSGAEAAEAKEKGKQTAEKGDEEALRVEEKEKKPGLSREQRENIRFVNVGRKKDFMCFERVRGKLVNILEGLELHTGVFSAAEQKRIVDFVYELQEKGRDGQLGEHTYSEPSKWMRGKGRVTIQFSCCYNYAVDKEGNPPGIIRSVAADPVPPLFKVIIRRLVRWHVIPPSCVPDSCIVNIYEPGDCIPPHIDNHDFVRPFCSVSFVSECNAVFGSNLRIVGEGEFSGPIAIPLPVGSVLVINGNGADVAKHCVPGVPSKRISITFRRMDEAKRPFGFTPEPDLQDIQPLVYETEASKKRSPRQKSHRNARETTKDLQREQEHPWESFSEFNPGRSPQDAKLLLQDLDRTRNKFHGRPSGSESLPHNSDRVTNRPSPRQIVNGRTAAGWAPGPDHRSELPGILPLPGGVETPVRSPHRQRPGSGSMGRIVRVEQKRIIVSRNLDEGEGESLSVTRWEPPMVNGGRRRPRAGGANFY